MLLGNLTKQRKMRRLVLYSDQAIATNKQVDLYLLQLLGTTNARIGYISSSSDPKRQYFTLKQEYYKEYGLELALYFELDVAYQPELLDSLFACDAIHLSGGNTYYFLYWLQQRGLIERLQHYALHEGVLIGISAGAIIMTPDVSSAQLCGDTPYAPLTIHQGLRLVDFAFVPHVQDTPEEYAYMQAYANEQKKVLYGCHDGDGIVVAGETITLVGNVVSMAPLGEY
ncbi:putative peptidase Lmo0363 [Calothrix sp. NIES-4071]|nr:putative peptidase Lmo0363 [Calothrix sp. NIES-4071]BAZ56936.1 putative peptidase Lmo0363 [Calothrix sp. NIES-4105]